MSEKEDIIPSEKEKSIKSKDPKRIAAGKKGAEAKKLKAELRKKETEAMKKENMKLKEKEMKKEVIQITKDDDDDDVLPNRNTNEKVSTSLKNYIPLCITVVGVGLGLYVYKSKIISTKTKQDTTMIQQQPVIKQPMIQKKQNDPFEF